MKRQKKNQNKEKDFSETISHDGHEKRKKSRDFCLFFPKKK
jgi:hypothetical protein